MEYGKIHELLQRWIDPCDAVFREASRILVDEGMDAVIGYLASHEADILSRVDRLASLEAEFLI
jgi:hypothetical protein